VKNRPFHHRLGFALKGIRDAFRTERSLRVQVAGLAFVILVLALVRPDPIWWAVLLLAAGLVLVAELFNSALEALADRVTTEVDPLICRAKDCAAGAVLVMSIAATTVALCFLVHLYFTR
jgi:undecaprenol kinase